MNSGNARKNNHQVAELVFLLEGLSFFFGHLLTSLLSGLPHLYLVYTRGANVCISRYISPSGEKTAIAIRRAKSIALQLFSVICIPKSAG